MQLPIISHRRVWFALSTLLVAASVAAIALFPPTFGIDFTGGSLMELSFSEQVPAPTELQKVFHDAGIHQESVVQQVGEKGAIARLPTLDEATHQKALAEIVKAYPGTTELRFESVGPALGGELRTKALWSVTLVLVAIASYIAYAFRKVSGPVSSWAYGVVTLIVALTHDVIVPIGAFAVFAHFFPAELNSAFVAALLTILGFSVHDTIVVFDRIRENLAKRGGNFADVVNTSVNDTLGRSINTSLTSVFPMIAIFLFGGESLRSFSFVLIVGLVAGTYSSIFLAAPMLVEAERMGKGRR
jgi:preprotein translocase subunit SecF